jgi:lipoprotein NlpI
MSMDADHREYAHLYLFLARCRTGVPAKRMQASRELLRHLESRESEDDWFAFVGGYLTGSIDADKLLAEARTGTPHRQREKLCEAHAYIGARLMIAGDTAAARKRFQQAVDTKVGSFMEYNTSAAELRRAGLR